MRPSGQMPATGEGSQYLHMFADLAMCFDEVQHWLDFWRGLYADQPGDHTAHERRRDRVEPAPRPGERRSESPDRHERALTE